MRLAPIQNPEKIKKVGEIYEKVVDANKDYFDFWLNHTLFHWDFWISLALTILPWAVWLKVRKKGSADRSLFVIFFTVIVTCWLDFVGTSYGLWYYTGKVIPTIPVFVPWDFCVLPVFIALLIEYKPHFSPLVKAMIFAGVSAFIGEPVFLWLGFYVMVNWNILISFPIYFLIYLASYKIGTKKRFAAF